MYRRWKELSRTAEGTAEILNLAWTDLASNAVVGTRGLHDVRTKVPPSLDKRGTAASTPSPKTPAVRYLQKLSRYRWSYGIPALIVLFLTFLIAFATLASTLTGRANMRRMRQYLKRHLRVGFSRPICTAKKAKMLYTHRQHPTDRCGTQREDGWKTKARIL